MKFTFILIFSFKVSGEIPAINLRISDARLFNIAKHIQSFPFPKPKQEKITNVVNDESKLWANSSRTDAIEQTLETIENMIPLNSTTETLADENRLQEQLIKVEANFKLSQVIKNRSKSFEFIFVYPSF